MSMQQHSHQKRLIVPATMDPDSSKKEFRRNSHNWTRSVLRRVGAVFLVFSAAISLVGRTQRAVSLISKQATAIAVEEEEEPALTCTKPILTVDPTGNLTTFIEKVFEGLNQAIVHERPIEYVAEHYDAIPNTITKGNWLEFGVYGGNTIMKAYDSVKNSSSNFQGKFFGFDSFEGLPSKWREHFYVGKFATNYNAVRAKIPQAIGLYKGWFQDTIPTYIHEQHPRQEPLALVHHDADLFMSTTITFNLLGRLIRPRTVLCFDELVGYPGYEQHEILSLYLWMHQYHAKLCPLAFHTPYTTLAMKSGIPEQNFRKQSACFQVLEMD